MDQNRRLQELFSTKISQMAEELEQLSRDMAPANTEGLSPAVSERIRTIAHSLHGAGTMYGFNCVSELGAGMTALLDALRAHRAQLTAGIIDLFRSAAALLREIARPGPTPSSVTDAVSGLAWKCECAIRGAAPADTAASPVRVGEPASTA